MFWRKPKMPDAQLSVRGLSEARLREIETPLSINLAFGAFIIEVHSNSADLLASLKTYYRGFVCTGSGAPVMRVTALECEPPDLDLDLTVKQPEPGKSKIKEEFVDVSDGRIVKKRLTGMHFCFGNGINMALGPCRDNPNQIINFINNRYIQWLLNRDYILGHAAAVVLDGVGIAVAGFSGAGKSTLALHLMNCGATFVSNDRLLVKQDNGRTRMAGVAKLPRVNPGTVLHNPSLKSVIPQQDRTRFSALPADELWDLEEKYDVYIDDVYGSRKFDLFGTMDMLVILNWKRTADPVAVEKVDPRERTDLLQAFIKSPGLFYEPEIDDPEIAFSEQSYIEHLSPARMYEFSGGADFESATQKCLELTQAMRA